MTKAFRPSRREFATALIAAGAAGQSLFGASKIDEALKNGLAKRKIPSCTAMVATPDGVTYTGAFGKRDSAASGSLNPDAIFLIASMTKAITTAAAMQLLEQGKVSLDE